MNGKNDFIQIRKGVIELFHDAGQQIWAEENQLKLSQLKPDLAVCGVLNSIVFAASPKLR